MKQEVSQLQRAGSPAPPKKNFLRDYGKWQNRLTACLLPFSLFSYFFEQQSMAFLMQASTGFIALGGGLLFISLIIELLTHFKQRPAYKFDSYQLPFFALGLLGTGIGCLFIPKMILDYSLLALAPLPFILPWLLSPISVTLRKTSKRVPPKYTPRDTHYLLIALASISGYFSFSNYDFFFTIPGVLFEAILNFFSKSAMITASYPLLAFGVYGLLMASAGIVYSRIAQQKLFGIKKYAYYYLLAFALGLSLIASMSLAGAVMPFAFNIVGIISFIAFSITGSIHQGRRQHQALRHLALEQSYQDTLKMLSGAEKAELEQTLEARHVIDKHTKKPLLKPVKVTQADGSFSIEDKHTVKHRAARNEPHIDRKFQKENERALAELTHKAKIQKPQAIAPKAL